MRYDQKIEDEERNRLQKLKEHKNQYQVVSFKNQKARNQVITYEDKLRERGRLARGGINMQYHKYTGNLENI